MLADLRIRAIEPDDSERLNAFFDRLSPDSRRRRFLVTKARLEEDELTFLTEVDHVTHEALVAVDRDGRIVGVSRYVCPRGRPDVAELAVAVADELHRRGIGRTLARRIVQRARANGVARLTATSLRENVAALKLLIGLGFQIRELGYVVALDLDLGALRAAA